jgi:predicted MFS family arabinose efflux permease
MLGLFMLLPVLALYAADFEHSSPALIGLALGIYGLSQALLQIPFGMLSDRIGRKPVIYGGLLLFGLGSVVAATAVSIWGVILGRAMQGSGAIASTILALLSDLTRDEQRTKAMAFIGMSIGLTFAAALLIGPWVAVSYGIRGIFWLTALLALGGIGIMAWLVPAVTQPARFNGDTSTAMRFARRVLIDRELLRLNLGIFSLHFILTASFVALPLMLRDTLHLQVHQHPWVYLSVLGGSFVAMVPLLIYAERRQKVVQVFLLAIAMLAIAALMMALWGSQRMVLLAAMFVFFMAFNLLEANLPSMVSKKAFPGGKGTAMGVYSTFQFIGAFLGGSIGGWMMGALGFEGVFTVCALITLLWFTVARGMQAPGRLKDVVLEYDAERFAGDDLLRDLAGLSGVEDVTLIADDCLVYLKVNGLVFDHQCLRPYRIIASNSPYD